MSEAGPRELTFAKGQWERMRELAESAYPFEGCGVLGGRALDGGWEVSEVFPGRNLVQDRRHDRYELDPRDIIAAERACRSRGEEVLGFFHTHPDHPARPSQFDRDHAWPGYVYLVCAVDQGAMRRATAWILAGQGEGAEFEELATGEEGAPGPGYNPPGVVVES
ncbi:MAG: M67 family metallopeptidase [Candidatus Dormibacteraeota bacterium]|nr:M67 family metallopeptidase [Candidatus Dormibacteraeota bacterium]